MRVSRNWNLQSFSQTGKHCPQFLIFDKYSLPKNKMVVKFSGLALSSRKTSTHGILSLRFWVNSHAPPSSYLRPWIKLFEFLYLYIQLRSFIGVFKRLFLSKYKFTMLTHLRIYLSSAIVKCMTNVVP